jgi:Glycosyltransferase family 87
MLPPRILVKIRISHVFFLYLAIAVIASIQCYLGSLHPSGLGEKVYHSYNNYILFKNSFFHLTHGKDLYISYPEEQWDLYKYSPTFSLFFGLLAYLPDFIGLLLWSLLNTIPLLIGFVQLRGISDNNKVYALLFCSIELLGNLQNSQSNGLMAALMILTFTSLENRRYLLATFLVVFSVYLKIYGGIGVVLFLFYPVKTRLLLYTIGWFLLLGILPLLAIDLNQLIYLYKSWAVLLKTDQANSIGISVMGILQTWFKINFSKNLIIFTGIILFLLPLLQVRKYKIYEFRLLVLCSALIWMVIFNHKAESPTYIISVCGIAIWFFSQNKTRINIILLILTLIFTTLSSGDLFPHFIKEVFIKPYDIKALFPMIIFGKILYELFEKSMMPGELSMSELVE